MNGLVSNALKNAFPGDRKGTIRINALQMEDQLEFTVADDSIGVPKGFDWKTTPSPGLHLVNSSSSSSPGRSHLTGPGQGRCII